MSVLCGESYYTYEAIVKKWLSYVVWKGCPKAYANSFLKQEVLVRGSPQAPKHDTIWKVPHVFYQGTLSSSSETNLYFLSSDIELLLDYMLDQYPTLDRRLLSPGPEKLVQSHMFSSPPHPISFSTVEALQANRQGSKLTHNSALLADNKKIYADFAEKGNGAVLAVDIESWERDHSVILEFGWSYISWSRDEQGNVKEQRKSEHLIAADNLEYENGEYTQDNKQFFNFGRSETISSKKALSILFKLIESFSSSGPLLLVFHNATAEIDYFRDLGANCSNWVTGFSVPITSSTDDIGEPLLIDHPADIPITHSASLLSVSGNPCVEKGFAYIQDTQKLFAASGLPGAIPQIGLANALKSLQIPYKRMHNAGNDAHYTLAVYEALVGVGSIRNDLQQQESQKKEVAQTSSSRSGGNGWAEAWGTP